MSPEGSSALHKHILGSTCGLFSRNRLYTRHDIKSIITKHILAFTSRCECCFWWCHSSEAKSVSRGGSSPVTSWFRAQLNTAVSTCRSPMSLECSTLEFFFWFGFFYLILVPSTFVFFFKAGQQKKIAKKAKSCRS